MGMIWLGRDLSVSICEYYLWSLERIPERRCRCRESCWLYMGLSNRVAHSAYESWLHLLRLIWGDPALIKPTKDSRLKLREREGIVFSEFLEPRKCWEWEKDAVVMPASGRGPQSSGSVASWKVKLARRQRLTHWASRPPKRIIIKLPTKGR